MTTARGFELTYCSNIHPAHGWSQVSENLRRIAVELKSRISPAARFGVGLRLSNQETAELLEGQNLREFQDFLNASGLYVALLNGFPFASFHDCRLKDQVFAPDWHTQERVDYTLRLAAILSALLPEDLDGSISTSPLSYKRWGKEPDWPLLVRNVVRVVRELCKIRRDKGRTIHVDIEPEPDGLVEDTPGFISFYERLLMHGAPLLAHEEQLGRAQAERVLREHVALCYDVCHFAVEHEEPVNTLTALKAAGVPIGRAQISSAIRLRVPDAAVDRETLRAQLEVLADATYLHQVIGRNERFADLPEALAHFHQFSGAEWRVHYHVPLFLADYGSLSSTQGSVRSALAHLSSDTVRHLEIETYTWNVLPASLKLEITDSIEREYQWVLAEL